MSSNYEGSFSFRRVCALCGGFFDFVPDTCLATEAGDACAISHTRAAIEQSSAAIKRGPGAEDSGCPRAPLRLRLLRVVEVEVGPEAVVARI